MASRLHFRTDRRRRGSSLPSGVFHPQHLILYARSVWHTTYSDVKGIPHPCRELSIEPGCAPSRGTMKALEQLLDGALRRAGLEPASDLWAVLRAWPEAVGARVAAHAMPIALAREELVVAVPDAVWRQELALLTPEIADGVNRMIGRAAVRRVRLVGAAATPEPTR